MPVRVLLAPTVEPGAGTGHLSRCLRMLPRLGPGARILIPPDSPAAAAFRIPPGLMVPGLEGRWDLIVLDRKRTDLAELSRFLEAGPVAALDEGGEARAFTPFLIDTLPLPRGRGLPNIGDSGFLDLPDRTAERVRGFDRVLLSFGGEDPAGLSGSLARRLIRRRIFRPEQLTVVTGPLFRSQELPSGVAVVGGVSRLPDIFPEYDLLFTSFGLTAYEAAAAGLPVILLNPSGYHRTLARIAAFPEIGVLRPSIFRLRRLLSGPAGLQQRCGRIPGTAGGDRRDLAEFLRELPIRSSAACPVCGTGPNPASERFHDRSFFRCVACGMHYLLSVSGEKKEYRKEYFFEEYRTQYGRTYLEDFDSILASCRPRAAAVRALLRGSASNSPSMPPAILDVGCAYGPFLAAAREAGFEPFGIDVAEDAVRWVSGHLDIPAATSDVLAFDPVESFGRTGFDAVTLWYVIEHFPDLAALLAKIRGLLPTGGVLAFSTPNGSGISMRSNRRRFLSRSPVDHFTIWSPRIAREVLARYGFSLKRVRVTGHHPERFPVLGTATTGTGVPARLLRSAILGISRLFGLGDTFEAYAVKRKEPGT